MTRGVATNVLFLCGVLASQILFAQEPEHQIILLPIAMEEGEVLYGSRGTEWRGEVWYRNTVGVSYEAQNRPCYVPPCAGVGPDTYDRLDGFRKEAPDAGVLLTIPADYADDLHLSNRIYESVGGAQPLGVEVPVVREREFRTEPIELLHVPVDAANRVAIRVYDPTRTPGATVRLEIVSPTGQVIGTRTLAPGSYPKLATNPFVPGYDAVFDVVGEFPAVLEGAYFHARLVPVTEGMAFWGFASVTDNESQHVALITPQ